MPAATAKADRDRVLGIFPELAGRLDVSASSLSGGQQQMLALGRALMSSPKLLLIDELSFGLAPRIVRDLFEVVRELREQGVTFLIVEQQSAALRISDRTYILRAGATSSPATRRSCWPPTSWPPPTCDDAPGPAACNSSAPSIRRSTRGCWRSWTPSTGGGASCTTASSR